MCPYKDPEKRRQNKPIKVKIPLFLPLFYFDFPTEFFIITLILTFIIVYEMSFLVGLVGLLIIGMGIIVRLLIDIEKWYEKWYEKSRYRRLDNNDSQTTLDGLIVYLCERKDNNKLYWGFKAPKMKKWQKWQRKNFRIFHKDIKMPLNDEKGIEELKRIRYGVEKKKVIFVNGTPHCIIHGAMNKVSKHGMWRCLMCHVGYDETTKRILKDSTEGFRKKTTT